jgi:hypothetical protein
MLEEICRIFFGVLRNNTPVQGPADAVASQTKRWNVRLAGQAVDKAHHRTHGTTMEFSQHRICADLNERDFLEPTKNPAILKLPRSP